MDIEAFLMTLILIVLSELGDKTQLATIVLSAKYKSPSIIFLGSMIAFVIVTGVGVLFGDFLSKIIPMGLLIEISASTFILIGVLIIAKKI